jgi:hypothetical protein
MYMRAISERKYAAERALHVRSGNDNVCAIGEKMSLGHKLLREHKWRGYIYIYIYKQRRFRHEKTLVRRGKRL